MRCLGWLCLTLALLGPFPLSAAELPARDQLGRAVKLRILVDKVLQPEGQWVTQEWMVQATAEAGFNVLSPRKGFDKLDEVRQVAQWCQKHGIYYMPWMRGTLDAPKGSASEGRRVIWADGTEQLLWSPNSDEFWEWTNRYIVAYAKMSVENPSLMGVFLDYENYAAGARGNVYSLSYDDQILNKFAQSQGITLPSLKPSARKAWLEEQKLHDEFEQFQVNHWRERCRALRQAVDEHAPAFQFCIYPAPGTPFMVEAIYPEWSTARAPLILADPYVYGRPSSLIPQKEALDANRQKLVKNREIPEKSGIPFLYAGGIDPVVHGADPEFSGKNAVMCSETTDGYWIFYEGPNYKKADHAEYWKWFTWANRTIDAGRLKAWLEPRETPEEWKLGFLSDAPSLNLVAPEKAASAPYPLVRLRGDNTLVLACKAGQPVAVDLKAHPVGKHPLVLIWEVRHGTTLEKIAATESPSAQEAAIRFTPNHDGWYLLAASAGSAAWSVVESNVPVGLFAAKPLHTIGGAKRLYFHISAGLAQFTLSLTGEPLETVRLNVFDPSGKQVATGQTSKGRAKVDVTVPVGEQADAVWSLALVRADEGVLEDSTLTLDAALPPTLSLVPEEAFRLAPKK